MLSSSSPGMSGTASRATSHMPAASSGRSAHVTISIPSGGAGAGALSGRQVEHEPGVPPDLVVAVAGGPGEADLVVLAHRAFELGRVVVGRPALERVEDGDADAGAAEVGQARARRRSRGAAACASR